MEIVQRARFKTALREARSPHVTIVLGYVALAIVLILAIYFDALSSGTAPGEFATMTVFP
jgi:hypothetical protein